MSDLRIQVEADYSEVAKLQSKIEELKSKIANFNPTITPRADLTKMQNELRGAQEKFSEISTRIGMIGNAATQSGQKIGNFSDKSAKSIREIATAFQDTSKAASGFGNNMNEVGSQLGGLIKQYSAATLVFNGVQSAISKIKQSFDTIVSFQAANSTLQAITGASDAAMDGFRETAEKLGRVTVYTAAQVTELQTALAKLGFEASDIHAMEKDVLGFAQAVGASLDEAAETTGAALRMFQVDKADYETKTKEFTNAMASATMSSALDFRMIRDNLATFGPMAKAMGFQIEDVLALFGKLKDNGVEASTAMTSLRNIFTKMAQGKIDGLSAQTNNLDDFVKGLKELQGLDTGKGMKMIGPRGGTQFITLINQADSILALRDKIKASMSGDTTGEMSEKMVNNLAGQLKMLQSAWEDFVLAFRNSDGVIKDALAGATDMIMGFRDLIAGNGDFTKEQLEGVMEAVKWVIGAIAAMKATSLAGSAARAVSNKIEDVRDAVEAEQLRKKGAAMAEAAGMSDRLTASEHKRTIAMREAIQSMTAEINLERERALEEMKLMSVQDDAAMKQLRRAENEMRTCEERIALYRRLGQEQIETAARFQSIGNTVAQERALQSADRYSRLEANATGELRTRRANLTNAQNAVLAGGGRQDLVNVSNIQSAERAMSRSAKAASALKMGLEGIIGVPINPVTLGIAAIAALGFAIYKLCSYKTDLEQLNEKVTESFDKVAESSGKTIAKLKTHTAILEENAVGTKGYKDSLAELIKMADQYGVTLDITKDKEQNPEKVNNLAVAKHELAAAIKEEAEANQYAAGLAVINEAEEERAREALKKFKDDIKDIDPSGVMATYGAQLAEDAENAEAKLSHITNMWKQVRDSQGTDAANKQYGAQLAAAQKEAEAEMSKLSQHAEQLALNMGKSKDEAKEFAMAIQKYANLKGISMGDSTSAMQYLNGLKQGIEGVSDSFSLAERQAVYAKKSVSALKEEIAKVAKNHRVNIKIDFEGEPPKWMSQLGWNSDKYRRAGAFWATQFADMQKKGQKYRVINGQKYSAQQIGQKAADYTKASEDAAEKEKVTPTAVQEESEKERKKREKAEAKAAAAAEKRKNLREKLHNELVQMQLKNDDEEISVMEEGVAKKIEKRDQQFRKEMEQLRKQAQEWASSNKKAGVTGTTSQVQVWSNDGEEQTITGLTGDQAAAITRRKGLLDQSREKDKADIFKDYDPTSSRKEKEAELTRDIEAMEQSIAELEATGSKEAAENMQKRLEYAEAMLKVSQLQSKVEYLKGSESIYDQHEGRMLELRNKRAQIDPSDVYALLSNQREMDDENTHFADEVTMLKTNFREVWQDFESLSAKALKKLEVQFKDALENGVDGKAISKELAKDLKKALSQIKAFGQTGGSKGGTFGDGKLFGKGGMLGESWIGKVGQMLKRVNDAEKQAAADNEQWEADKASLDEARQNQANLTDQYNAAKNSGDLGQAQQLQGQLQEAQQATQAAQAAEASSGAQAAQSAQAAQGAGNGVGLAVTDLIIHGVNQNVQSWRESVDQLYGEDSDTAKGWKQFAVSSQYATDGFDAWKQGDFVGAINNATNAVYELGGSLGWWSTSNREEMAEQNEKLELSNENLTNALNRLTKVMQEQSGSEAYKTLEASTSALETQEANARSQIFNNLDTHDSKGHSLAYDYNSDVSRKFNNRKLFDTYYKLTGDEKFRITDNYLPTIQDVLNNFRPKDLEKLYYDESGEGTAVLDAFLQGIRDSQDSENYNGLATDILNYMNDYSQENYDALEDEFYETVNGLSFDSFRDNFVSMMMDLESEVDDFADSFNEQLTQSIMNDVIKSQYKDQLEKLYNEWGDLITKRTGENKISEKEFYKQAEELQQREIDLSAKIIETRDAIAAATGYDDNESQKATRASIENITQDQADQLIGRITAIQIAVEANNANNAVGTTVMSAIQTQLASMANEQLTSRLEFTNQMADVKNIMAQSYIELRGINQNTEAIVDPIKTMQDDMYRMRQKMDTL